MNSWQTLRGLVLFLFISFSGHFSPNSKLIPLLYFLPNVAPLFKRQVSQSLTSTAPIISIISSFIIHHPISSFFFIFLAEDNHHHIHFLWLLSILLLLLSCHYSCYHHLYHHHVFFHDELLACHFHWCSCRWCWCCHYCCLLLLPCEWLPSFLLCFVHPCCAVWVSTWREPVDQASQVLVQTLPSSLLALDHHQHQPFFICSVLLINAPPLSSGCCYCYCVCFSLLLKVKVAVVLLSSLR